MIATVNLESTSLCELKLFLQLYISLHFSTVILTCFHYQLPGINSTSEAPHNFLKTEKSVVLQILNLPYDLDFCLKSIY